MSEVAGIWVEGNENITTYKRSIVVYGRSEHPTHIQPYFTSYDPLSYPMFFPNGEAGWHSRIPREGVDIRELVDDDDDVAEDEEGINTTTSRKTVTVREYYRYKFQIRPYHTLILFGGRLFQQFVVDTYIKIETSRLQFCGKKQSTIRADLYQGIIDCVNVGEVQSNRLGQIIVLHVSFICEDPRAHMHKITLDSESTDVVKQEAGTNLSIFLHDLQSDLAEYYSKYAVPLNYAPTWTPKAHGFMFQETTQQGDDSYPLYRQRDNGIEKNIKRFHDARYVSPPEAMWRIYGFPLSNVYPSVMSLQVHLPNKQFVTLEEDVVLTNILERERNKRSMLTAFFELNQTDTQARQHLYKDIPQFYTWNKSTHKGNRQKQGNMRGRMVSTNLV
ncbi:uncharacterized protein Tco_0328409 [Tanacetum coccineum]